MIYIYRFQAGEINMIAILIKTGEWMALRLKGFNDMCFVFGSTVKREKTHSEPVSMNSTACNLDLSPVTSFTS